MATTAERGQVMVEAVWLCLVLFSLLLFLAHFSFRVDQEQTQFQFNSWVLRHEH